MNPAPSAAGPTATRHADVVERWLGDPYETANPYGFQAITAARQAGRPLPAEPLSVTSAPDGAATEREADLSPEALLHGLRVLYRRSPALAGLPTGDQDDPDDSASGAARLGAAVGTLDSGLRLTLRHLRARRLYGAPASDIPQLRAVLAGAFADLLLCDALTTLAARGVDALPDRPGAHAQAVRHLVPRALQGAMDRLSMLLGSRFYLTEGEHAAFPLLLRELQRDLFAAGRAPATPAPLPAAPEALAGARLGDAPAVAALCDPTLLAAAPATALTTDVHRPTHPSGPAQEHLYAELVRRYETGRTFDLTDRAIPDRPQRAH